MSGWQDLAVRYRTGLSPEGERLRWSSAQIGGVSFRSCLNITLGQAGLFLVPTLPFRMFMPLLMIPWADVKFEGVTRMFFFEFSCFRLGAEGPVFAVFGRTAERFRPYLRDEARSAFESRRAFAGSLVDRRIVLVAVAASVVGLVAALIAASAR